jgi:hypothetical protein
MPGKDKQRFTQEEGSNPAKKVRFSLEEIKENTTKNEDGIFSSYPLMQKKEMVFSKIKKNVLNLFLAEEYVKAKNFLEEHLAGREKLFFDSQDGQTIFAHALNFLMDSSGLKCILIFMDQEVVGKLLKQDNYFLIKDFVERETGLMKTSIGSAEKYHLNKKLLLLYKKIPYIFKELVIELKTGDVSADALWTGLKIWFKKNDINKKLRL